jgi:hypothetical protein
MTTRIYLAVDLDLEDGKRVPTAILREAFEDNGIADTVEEGGVQAWREAVRTALLTSLSGSAQW